MDNVVRDRPPTHFEFGVEIEIFVKAKTEPQSTFKKFHINEYRTIIRKIIVAVLRKNGIPADLRHSKNGVPTWRIDEDESLSDFSKHNKRSGFCKLYLS